MGRNRFPQPQTVRLYLVDVHRRALHDFTEKEPERIKTLPEKDRDLALKDYRTKLAELESAVAEAEEDADWIDVKKELTAGETKHIYTDLIREMKAGQQAELDPRLVGLTKILQYVIGWSFVDNQGQPVPFSSVALDNLDPESYREVNAAVDWHDGEVEDARRRRKNVRVGENKLSPISPSVGS